MDTKLILFSSYELILSIVFGLITICIIDKMLEKFFFKEKISTYLIRGNKSVALFCGVITICILLMVQSSILPSVSALQSMVMNSSEFTFKIVLMALAYFSIFYVIALTVSLFVFYSSFKIYTTITAKIDEILELKNDNIACAIIVSLTMLGLSLIIRMALKNFLGSMVNYQLTF